MNKAKAREIINEAMVVRKERNFIDKNGREIELFDLITNHSKKVGIVVRFVEEYVRVEWIGKHDYDILSPDYLEVIGSVNINAIGQAKFKRFDVAFLVDEFRSPREYQQVVVLTGPDNFDSYKCAFDTDLSEHVEVRTFKASEDGLLTQEERDHLVEEFEHTVEGKEDDGEFVDEGDPEVDK